MNEETKILEHVLGYLPCMISWDATGYDPHRHRCLRPRNHEGRCVCSCSAMAKISPVILDENRFADAEAFAARTAGKHVAPLDYSISPGQIWEDGNGCRRVTVHGLSGHLEAWRTEGGQAFFDDSIPASSLKTRGYTFKENVKPTR